ncbi:MAG: hypothetical protein JXA18_14040 [Chitinispirillaceae bacterium]|nr:hypothetical protein [Chitinispirillaceae bacterium]
MANEEKLFHESWHRIAGQKIALRSNVRIIRQMFRGRKWYVVADPCSNNFYRLRPAAYTFVARLNSRRTIEEVWRESLNMEPEEAPGQGEIIELLAQLYHANLLHYDLAPDSTKLFERYSKKKQQLFRANLANIMFFRIPLFDPAHLVNRIEPLLRWIISPAGGLVWVAAVAIGIKIAIDNAGNLQEQSQGILAPSNLFLLYIGVVIVKICHEFGHAFAVRRFGGEVHTMGVMFLIFSPLPYMDATAAWAFRNKWQRVFVGAAGMIFELFVASCAIMIWANTGDGVIHSLMYNMIFVASVSTVVFNINPLLRYDGYYILSDILNIPNLHHQARQQLTWLIEWFAFGCKYSETPAATRREVFWLSSFGILSTVYRFFVFSAILIFVADRFLLAGIIMAVICAVAWVIVPVVKLVRYLGSSPRLERTRARAIAVTCATVAGGVIIFNGIPFPWSSKAPGVVKAVEYGVVVNETGGYVTEICARSGTRVRKGMPLIKMENPELMAELRETQAALNEFETRFQKAMQEMQADMKPIKGRLDYLEKKYRRLNREREHCTVTAVVKGIWVAPDIEDMKGMWITRGTSIGQLVNDAAFHFVSAVSQQDVAELFAGRVRSAKVRLAGQAEHDIKVTSYTTVPMEQTNLPSSALGWGAGGEIAVDASDEKGVKTTEPFYEVRAIVDNQTKAALFHGRSGKIKFNLPMKPLLQQGWRKLRQMIQKRYHI